MKKKLSKAIPQVLEQAKEWCGYCKKKSRSQREDLVSYDFEYWECQKCKLIDEYRK